MSNNNTLSTQIATLRTGTVSLLETIANRAKAFDLPAPPPILEEYRTKLAENTYTVLVVGEAKRGKSSFVNALIGRSILPTNVEIATSQVFQVYKADHEEYAVCFEDESRKTITQDDLMRYGSQAEIDVHGLPQLSEIIRWLEVGVPTTFLPQGVRLLDTPGLGSLYAAHAQITQRFVPFADAVIFVLDSEKPIIQRELEFLDELLKVTPNVFFVQTKIDAFHRDEWQDRLKRNQSILQEQFKDRLTDTRIWPISSKNLLQAGETGDDDYLMVSYYQPLAVALNAFLFRVTGQQRASRSIAAAKEYASSASQTLEARRNRVTAMPEQAHSELQKQLAQRKRDFEAEWGTHGKRWYELQSGIYTIAITAKENIIQVLSEGGELEQAFRDRINAVNSVGAASAYMKAMPAEITMAVHDKWYQVEQRIRSQYAERLGPFLIAANGMNLAIQNNILDFNIDPAGDLKIKINWWGVIAEAGSTYSSAGSAVSKFNIQSSSHLAPFATATPIICATFQVLFSRGQIRTKKAQEQLNDYLTEALKNVRQQLLKPDITVSVQSRMDKYFEALTQAMFQQIQQIALKMSEDTQAELDHMETEAKLNEQERAAQAQKVVQQLNEWTTIENTLKDLTMDVKILDISLLGPATFGS